MLSNDKQVNFKDYPLFTKYVSDFEIVEVKHLHAELDDDALNSDDQIKLKLQSKKMLSKDKQVNFKHYPLFTEYLSDFEIVEVKHLHPEVDDDLLNRTYQIKLNDWSKVDALVKKLNRHSMIEYAELKDLHRKLYTPNDALYGVSNQWGLFTIEAEQAWDISLGNSNVVVAVT